jgi:hypothetical protein
MRPSDRRVASHVLKSNGKRNGSLLERAGSRSSLIARLLGIDASIRATPSGTESSGVCRQLSPGHRVGPTGDWGGEHLHRCQRNGLVHARGGGDGQDHVHRILHEYLDPSDGAYERFADWGPRGSRHAWPDHSARRHTAGDAQRAPLYRFFQDSAPGTIKGNGIEDSFNGVSFTWHVESGGGSPTTAPSSSGYGH